MFIIYSSHDEVIVCTKDTEQEVIKEYFNDPEDRDINNYNREESSDTAVVVQATLHTY